MEKEIEEALKELEEELKWTHNDGVNLTKYDERLFNVIKQALLKAQEQKKALEIIKEKKIDVVNLWCSLDAESYNLSIDVKGLNDSYKITQVEFKLLEEVLKCI